jgi:predicted nucleic acid-binding protein
MHPFIDANVIVNAFTENKERKQCRAVISGAFVTDCLCLVEAYNFIAKISKSMEHASESVKSLFSGPGTIVQLDKNLLYLGLKAARDSRFNIFDSIHYAAALLNNCSEIVSYDRDFDNLPIKRTEP